MKLVFTTTVLLTVLGQGARAATITFPNGAVTETITQAGNSNSPSTNLAYGTTGNSQYSGGPGTFALGSIDMTTGQLKAAAVSTASLIGDANGYEFLAFSKASTISFSFTIGGTMGASGFGDYALMYGFLNLMDVTNVNQFFNPNGTPTTAALANLIGSATVNAQTVGAGMTCTQGTAAQDCYVDSTGVLIPITKTGLGSASVLPGHIYMIVLHLVADTETLNGSQAMKTSDFSHTATVAFTDLGGNTFTSESGQFLSGAAAVPEPSTGL